MLHMRDRSRRDRRRALQLLLLLTALALSAGAGVRPEQEPNAIREPAQDQDQAPREFDVTEQEMQLAMSGCDLCQQTGMCGNAFHNQPGHFCLALASGRPCCCPDGAECVANPINCRCRMSVNAPVRPNNQSPVRVVTTKTTSSDSGGPSHWFLLVAALLACCCCCGCCCKQNDQEQQAYQQPVYMATEYGTAPQQYYDPNRPQQASYPYARPSAPPMVYEAPHYHDGGNSLAAGALGGVAGLAGGLAIGSMFGGGGRDETVTTTTTTEYFGGDVGFGTTAASTYDFSGDTGGGGGWGGGDFGGDDGGVFNGDS